MSDMKKKKSATKLMVVILAAVIVIAAVIAVIMVNGNKSDRDIVESYIANKDKQYTDEEKISIVNAYKNMLDTEGEAYVDEFLSKEDQTDITYMGMTVNVYVFRDFKNYGYLNSDNSFIDVAGYSTIAGFDVDAQIGPDGLANLEQVEIVIDGKSCAVADLRDEIADFMQRFDEANASEKTTTIYGVDKVDIDENTRLYITYLDVQFDDSRNVTALRVSGHLLTK